MHSVREKRRKLWETSSWLLHHDNAPAHNALGIREFFAKNNIAVLEQSPYSPDWPLVTSFCFPNSRRELRAISEESFQECMEAWQRRLEKCILAQGD